MKFLFDSGSFSNNSETFMLDQQKTIVATGLAEGDWIGFEILTVANGKPSSLCGCILTPAQIGQVSAITPLMCPTCPSDTPQFVRLTPNNPSVILDNPAGVLLRAVYNGVALDDRAVTVTIENSATQDLTDSMRGCPPVCCEDEPQTWTDTGTRRCDDASMIVEILEISNCGNTRWTVLPTQPQAYWARTGVQDCSATNVRYQEQNPCGGLRWVDGEALVWVETGTVRCGAAFMENQEQNQCGDIRWTVTVTPVTWVATGASRCFANMVQHAESNQCGSLRWVDQYAVTWVATGLYDCQGNVRQRQEQNDCGGFRWVATGEFCGNSTHAVAEVRSLGDAFEGDTACWEVMLEDEVQGAPLTINLQLSGQEQDVHNYAVDPLVIPVGGISGVVCVDTAYDDGFEPPLSLCLKALTSLRVTSSPMPSCLNIIDEEEPEIVPTLQSLTAWEAEAGDPDWTNGNAPSASVLESTGPDNDARGACFRLLLTSPAQTDMSYTVVFSGEETTNASYPSQTVTIFEGDEEGYACVGIPESAGTTDRYLTATATAALNPVDTKTASVYIIDASTADPGDSVHVLTTGVGTPDPANEGATICWPFTLDIPVAGNPLTVYATLSGSEQDDQNYAVVPVVVAVGDSSGQFCINTTNDTVIEGAKELCLFVTGSNRLTTVNNDDTCVTVNSDDNPSFLSNSYVGSQPCHARTSNHNAAANQGIYILTDGTWAVRNGVLGANGTPRSGSWLAAGVASAYEVRFQAAGETSTTISGSFECEGQGTTTTPITSDSGWLAVTEQRSYLVNAFAAANVYCDGDSSASADVTVTIREIANPSNTVTGIVTLCSEASAIAGT